MTSRLVRLLVLASLSASLGACEVLEPPTEQTLTLYVGPATVDCVGSAPQRCLQVRERHEDPWSYLYDPIVGFTHEAGYSYTLRVVQRQVENPLADASSYEYRLVRIVERVAAPAGSTGAARARAR